MKRALCALAAVSALLAGCAVPAVSTAPAATDGADQDATGFGLSTATAVFDPAFDVPGVEVCDGLPGREELESFDRAPWPDLDIDAGTAILTCGNADGAGWRHIADGHVGDFNDIARYLDVGWEDVAWWAIDQALEAPDQVEWYRSDIANYDVLLEVHDLETGELVGEWMVTVGVGMTSGNIITSFPDDTP